MADGDITSEGEGAQLAEKVRSCPKCRAISGDDWSQCNDKCPVKGSPHFDEETFKQFGPLVWTDPRDMEP